MLRIVEALLEPLDGCVGKLAQAKKNRSRRRTEYVVVVVVVAADVSAKSGQLPDTFLCVASTTERNIRKYLCVCLSFSGHA